MDQDHTSHRLSSVDYVVDLGKNDVARNAFLDGEDIAPYLTLDEEQNIINFCEVLVRTSYRQQLKRFDAFTKADEMYDLYVPAEKTEFRERATITDGRAVCDTVVTYLMSALFGRNPMIQLRGLDRKSRTAAHLLERILHDGIQRGPGELKLAQLVLNSVRYGYAPIKVGWDESINANQLVNYSPYHGYTDPRANQTNVDQMQYVFFVNYFTPAYLRTLNRFSRMRGDLRGEMFSRIKRTGWEAHTWYREQSNGQYINRNLTEIEEDSGWNRLGTAQPVDEFFVMVPGEMLGLPGLNMVWLQLTVLGEQHVIELRLNPAGRQFPCQFGGAYFDEHKAFQQGVTDVLQPLFDVATWLLRSRVDNVQAALNNLIFADPTAVSIPDLINRNQHGVVPTLPGFKAGEGLFIAQVPDVTAGHWGDINMLGQQMKAATAAPDLQQGMPTTGIRSATEMQRMAQLGSQRLGLISRVMSAATIRPLARMMVQNIQDSLRPRGSVPIDKNSMTPAIEPFVQDGFLDYEIGDIQGDIDYLVITGADKMDANRDPDTLLRSLQILEQTGMLAEFDAGMITEELLNSLGFTDLDQFRIQPGRELSPSQQLQMLARQQGQTQQPPQVRPGEEVAREVERGNLVPLKQRQANVGGILR